MNIRHQHPNFLPEQRKSLLNEVHRSCRTELLRSIARDSGNALIYPAYQFLEY